MNSLNSGEEKGILIYLKPLRFVSIFLYMLFKDVQLIRNTS